MLSVICDREQVASIFDYLIQHHFAPLLDLLLMAIPSVVDFAVIMSNQLFYYSN